MLEDTADSHPQDGSLDSAVVFFSGGEDGFQGGVSPPRERKNHWRVDTHTECGVN